MFEYSGAIHIHSVFSDGSGTVDEIAGFANEVGLDYFILTDHNTMKAHERGMERWYDKTMMIVGYELNDLKNKNHYLVLGVDKAIGTFEKLPDGDLGNIKSANDYVKEINDLGGFGFIAHPDEKRNHLADHPPYPWTAWDCEDFTGIEIWNHMSEWMEGLTDKNKLNRFVHPLRSIIAPAEETLQKWDNLNLKRKVVAVGGVDAHALKYNVMGMTMEIFPYKVLFKSIRTHVFTENQLSPGNLQTFEKDKQEVLNALRNGRSFVVNYYHGDGRGFRFFAEYDGDIYNLGDEVKYNPASGKKVTLKVYLPKEAKIRLMKNGVCVDELTCFNCMWHSDEPGNYRIEAWQNNKGWIFSNNIRVTSININDKE